jgi:hypothetical protein
MSISTLTLTPARREPIGPDDDPRDKVPFMDFILDGTSIRSFIESLELNSDLISPLWLTPYGLADARETVDRTLGRSPGDAADGRVAMLVCPIDGDLSCGAIAAQVSTDGNTITWSNWIIDDEVVWIDGPPNDDYRKVTELPTFTFDLAEYTRAFDLYLNAQPG